MSDQIVHPMGSSTESLPQSEDGKPRKCFAIFTSQFVPGKGYVPSLVTEGEPGHQPFVGQGEESEPWYWGLEWDQACAVVDKANARDFRLTPDEAAAIVDSSITAQIRGDGAKARVAEKMERLGLSG